MSIAKGIVKTAENVVMMNADTMQIFSRNPRGSNYKDPTVKEAEEFQRIRREAGFGAILAHAPYTMNLASAKPEVYEFACTVIREDVTRMDRLGIENLVFHPGSHTGIGAEAGIKNIIAGLDQAITGKENITVLLESLASSSLAASSSFLASSACSTSDFRILRFRPFSFFSSIERLPRLFISSVILPFLPRTDTLTSSRDFMSAAAVTAARSSFFKSSMFSIFSPKY